MLLSELYIEDLPPTLQLIAELAGIEVCLRFVEKFGGSRVFFPKEGFAEDHPLREILDAVTCKALCFRLEGTVSIPVAKSAFVSARNRLIWRDRQRELTARELSQKYNLCERAIDLAVVSHEMRMRKISDAIRS